MRVLRLLQIGVLGACCALALGCSRSAAPEKSSDDTGAAWTLPSDWPKDVPVYAGAKIGTSASFNPDSAKPGSMLSMETSDSPQQVSSFYLKALKDNGWTVDGTTDGGKYTAVIASKEQRMVAVHATTGMQGPTSIVIGTGEK